MERERKQNKGLKWLEYLNNSYPHAVGVAAAIGSVLQTKTFTRLVNLNG